jgi:sporulation protein YlmC with PRC-barrel domain
MRQYSAAAIAVGFALLAGVPAFAQTAPQQPAQPASPPASQQASDNSDSPKVAVASVRLENGYRASKIIGASVYNDQNQEIGTVSDLYLSNQNQVAMAVISVGSFLGIGGKQVSVPFDKLQINDGSKVVMAGATKQELAGMPNVQFGG